MVSLYPWASFLWAEGAGEGRGCGAGGSRLLEAEPVRVSPAGLLGFPRVYGPLGVLPSTHG